jgi:AraC-like DNA-binding protein
VSDPALSSKAYLALLGDLVQRRGVDRGAWLAAAGLGPTALDEAEGLLPIATANLLVREALRRTEDPALGVHFGRRLNLNAHGLVGFAGMVSADLYGALDIGFRYIQTRVPSLELVLRREGPDAVIELTPRIPLDDELRRFLTEAVVFSFATMAEHLLGADTPPARVSSTLARPPYAELYYTLYPSPLTLQFDARKDAIAFDADWLTRPLPLADHHARLEAEQQLKRQLASPRLAAGSGPALSGQIAAVLAESAGYYPSLDDVAARLGTTPRTLHRRLTAASTSFQRILDEVRQREAERLLRNTGLSITQIAHLLGFSDSANFARSFRRWTGLAPLAWSKRAQPH